MEPVLTQKLLNSIGLFMDIVGAFLVASEVVRKFHGIKLTVGQSWDTMTDPPKETEEFKSWSERTFWIMKLGLFFLTVGFLLQIAANWTREILVLFGYS